MCQSNFSSGVKKKTIMHIWLKLIKILLSKKVPKTTDFNWVNLIELRHNDKVKDM